MGIYRVNTAKAKEGKLAEAKETALALAKYTNETYDINVQILTNFDGPSNTLHWVAYSESWAANEEFGKKFAQDIKAQELVAKCAEVIDLHNSEWYSYTVVE